MRTRIKIPPALKHGAYSATAILPGESRAAFEKLQRDLIAEYAPSGVLEADIVADMARLVWRKQNLWTLRIAERARSLWSDAIGETLPVTPYYESEEDEEIAKEEMQEARKELGPTFELIEIGEATTFDGLAKELDIIERLDGLIEKCLKRLLLVRGLKSIAVAPSSTPQRILEPSKAA